MSDGSSIRSPNWILPFHIEILIDGILKMIPTIISRQFLLINILDYEFTPLLVSDLKFMVYLRIRL